MSHTIEVGGFNDVNPKEGSKRPALKVMDGYDASGSNCMEDDNSSYEEVEVEVESGDLSENLGLMESTIKPPETAGAGLYSQEIVEDLGLDDVISGDATRNKTLSVVNNILLHDVDQKKRTKIVKKKKVKKTRLVAKNKGKSDWDSNNMISVGNVDDNSWNSNRKNAKNIDLSRASPNLTSKNTKPSGHQVMESQGSKQSR